MRDVCYFIKAEMFSNLFFFFQGALRKIMYEQQRKQMGLPTTEEET